MLDYLLCVWRGFWAGLSLGEAIEAAAEAMRPPLPRSDWNPAINAMCMAADLSHGLTGWEPAEEPAPMTDNKRLAVWAEALEKIEVRDGR